MAIDIVDELVAILGFDIEGEHNAKKFQNTLDRVDSKLQRFTKGVAKYGTILGGALSALFIGNAKNIVETNAQFEGFQTALETIEGSATKAKESLDWISNFGKTTPYEVANVTEAFIALKAYGIDPITDDALRTLGDTASAMNKPLMQAVEAFADAATGEFERLKEFGIRAKSEGENVTFSWTKNGEALSKTVGKNSNEIRKFLLETMGERFSGAMEKQSKTWNGILSNLSDTWVDFKKRVGDNGFFELVKGYLSELITWLNRLDSDGTLDRWAKALSDNLIATAEAIRFVFDRLSTHIGFLIDNFDSIQGPLQFLLYAFGLLVLRAFPLTTLFIGLSLALDDFLTYLEGGESVIGRFIDKIKSILGVGNPAAQSIVAMAGTIATALIYGFITSPLKTLSKFASILKFSLLRLLPFVSTVGWQIAKFFGGRLILGLIGLGPLIMKAAASAFALLSNPIGWAILLAGAAVGLIYYFWDDLKAAFNSLKEKAIGLFSNIKDWVLSINWSSLGSGMMTKMWNGMKSLGGSIKKWFMSLIPDWAKDWFNSPEQDRQAIQNLQGNLARSSSTPSATGSISNRINTDRRSQTVNNNVNINQNVAQAVDAPNKVADATAKAISGSSFGRSQLELEPIS